MKFFQFPRGTVSTLSFNRTWFRPKNRDLDGREFAWDAELIEFFGERMPRMHASESRSIRDCELWASGESSGRGSREGSVKGPARGWSGTTCGTAPWYLRRWYGGQQLAPDGQKLAGPAATARASPLFLLVAHPLRRANSALYIGNAHSSRLTFQCTPLEKARLRIKNYCLTDLKIYRDHFVFIVVIMCAKNEYDIVCRCICLVYRVYD